MKMLIKIINAVVAITLLLLTVWTLPAKAAQVTLGWTASTSANVGGYNIYYGTAPGVYTSTIDAGNVTTFTIPALPPKTLLYFALKTYNTDKTAESSSFSNEVFTTTPDDIIPPPLPLFTSKFSGYTVDSIPEKVSGGTQWVWSSVGSTQKVITRTLPTLVRFHYDLPGTYTIKLDVTTPTETQTYQRDVIVGQ